MAEFGYTVRRVDWEEPSHPVGGPRFHWRAILHRVHVLFVALHWTADPHVEDRCRTLTRAINYIRNMQRSYRRSRRFSVGYAVGITQYGASIEIRGTDFRSAATLGRKLTRTMISGIPLLRHLAKLIPDTSRYGNRHSIAVLWLCGVGGPSHEALVETARFIAWCEEQAGRQLYLQPHSFFDPTECCGNAGRLVIFDGTLRRLINARAWETPAFPPPDLDLEEEDMRPTIIVTDTKLRGTFALVSGRWVPWLGGDAYPDTPRVTTDHEWTREQILADQGPAAAELWRERATQAP